MRSDRWLIGSYAGKDETGICSYSVQENGEQAAFLYGLNGAENPSYLTLSQNGNLMYCVIEEMEYNGVPQGAAAAWKWSEGGYQLLNCMGTAGTLPCHIILDEERKLLFTANYGSGSVTMFALKTDGSIDRKCDVKQHTGKGADPNRQEGPHVHFLQFSEDNRGIWCVDLGLDLIRYYEIDQDEFCLIEKPEMDIHFPKGTGPRHIAVHPVYPEIWYVICELSSEICVVDTRAGEKIVQQVSTLVRKVEGNTGAAIKLSGDGRFLYASNRGDDSIAVFEVSEDARQITLLETVKTGGMMPRDIAVKDTYLLAANQGSGSITWLKRDEVAGCLGEAIHVIAYQSPVCLIADTRK